MNSVQVGDVDPQFHGWRAEEHRQFAFTEALLAILAVFLRHLSRVLPPFDPQQPFWRALVEVGKEGICPGASAAIARVVRLCTRNGCHPLGTDRIRKRQRFITGQPQQRIAPDLKRARSALHSHVNQNPCAHQDVEQRCQQRCILLIIERRLERAPGFR
jgi:hypothetical protein